MNTTNLNEAQSAQTNTASAGQAERCVSCDWCRLFIEYDVGEGRHENNCVTWLCNCIGCPKDING